MSWFFCISRRAKLCWSDSNSQRSVKFFNFFLKDNVFTKWFRVGNCLIFLRFDSRFSTDWNVNNWMTSNQIIERSGTRREAKEGLRKKGNEFCVDELYSEKLQCLNNLTNGSLHALLNILFCRVPTHLYPYWTFWSCVQLTHHKTEPYIYFTLTSDYELGTIQRGVLNTYMNYK